MLIFTIDAATLAGFALGKAGERPVSWSKRLKDAEDEPARAFKALGREIRDILAVNQVELLVIEAAMSMGGMVEKDDSERGFHFKSTPRTIQTLQGLIGCAHGIAGCYGVRTREGNVQAVRKHVLGRARPEDPKKAVLNRLHQIRYLEPDCWDNNRGDAVALHIWASDVFGKPATRELHMFGGRAAG